jgi:4-hydroxy-tetrahydrodipicolinate synthase
MQLRGAIPANILPFDAEGKIDEEAYREHLESLVSIPGLGALTCNGHAAEVASLDRAERRRATSVAAGRVPVICGIYSDDERDAADKARDAAADGADAILLMPPASLAYEDSLDAAERAFAHVAAAVDLPIIAFEYPEFTGLHYSPELLARICDIDAVVAVKEWSLDIRAHERNLEVVRSANHPVAMLTSFSTHLLPALAVGADGILSGHGSVVAAIHVQLLDEVGRDDLSAARSTYERLQHLTRVIYRDPMPNMYARMKEHLVMLGHRLQPVVRPPLRPVSEAERAQLRRALVAADLLPGDAA